MRNNNGHEGHKPHGILMLLCCLLPIVLLAMLPSVNFQSPGLKNGLGLLLLLVCPLGHLLMMKFMPNGHKHENGVEEEKRLSGKMVQEQDG